MNITFLTQNAIVSAYDLCTSFSIHFLISTLLTIVSAIQILYKCIAEGIMANALTCSQQVQLFPVTLFDLQSVGYEDEETRLMEG